MIGSAVRVRVRARLSTNNKYYIDTHRYYELKHFCLQYNNWKREYCHLDRLSKGENDIDSDREYEDPTYDIAAKRLLYFEKMKLVEQTVIAADANIHNYILKDVTEGRSYNYLKTVLDISCGKDLYYDRYRRFFWLLDKVRNQEKYQNWRDVIS